MTSLFTVTQQLDGTDVTVTSSPIGVRFLSINIAGGSQLLIPVSAARLQTVLNGTMSPRDAFAHPESPTALVVTGELVEAHPASGIPVSWLPTAA